MKFLKIVSAAALLASFSASADTAISASQLNTYQEAASIAVLAMNSSCLDAYGNDANESLNTATLSQIINNSHSATISTDGTQPVLTFTAPSSDGNEQSVVEVISSSDYKSAVKVIYLYQNLENVNSGTLLSPSISKGWVTTQTFTCS